MNNEPDINNALEAIFLVEEKLLERSYATGFETGKQQGNTEAYHLGYHRASEIGAELGYYLGIIRAQSKTQLNEKTSRLLKNLEDRIVNFPKVNDPNIDIFKTLDEIRSKYKQVCSSLKISGKYPEASNLSF